jgi:cystathionine beta-lyase
MSTTKFNFTQIIDREGKDAIAFDLLGVQDWAPKKPKEGFDSIPMWVADMNFAVPPSIQEEITKRVSHPCFGYFNPRKEYYTSIINWQKNHHGIQDLTEEEIGYENGVLGGVITSTNILCSKGDKILVHSPIYLGFSVVLGNNGYKIIHSDLKKDSKGIWRMDFKDMEDKIIKEKIHVCIFCNPHNPCGRVWEKEELLKMMELFEKYEVYVICDEIWSDLILFGNKHIPLQSINEYAKQHTISFYSPSKTFSLSGLIGSYHIIYNKFLRDRQRKESSLCCYNSINMLSMYALIGAYSDTGDEWVKELIQVLNKNVEFAVDFINNKFKGVKPFKSEGTYMFFVDCEDWLKEHNWDLEKLLNELWDVGATVQDGRQFNNQYSIRMNLASPFSRIKEAFERMDKYVFNKKE